MGGARGEAYLRRSENEGEDGNGSMYGCQLRKRTLFTISA